MPGAPIPQVSFGKGEISPLASARTDLQIYAASLQICENFFVHCEGGVSNRAGSQYVGACASNTPNGSFLLPFVYNNQQAYVVEFGPGTARLFSNGAFIQNAASATITNVTTFYNSGPNTTTITYTAVNSFTVGQVVTVSGVIGSGSLNPNGAFAVTAASGVSFQATVPGNVGFIYTSGGVAALPLNITTPYVLADLPNLRWAQSADTLNVAVSTQPLYQLKRLTPTNFTFTAPQLLFGPFQDLNTDGTTYVYVTGPAAASNAYSLSGTLGNVDIFASGPIFQAGHVGSLFQIQEQYLGSIPDWEAQKQLTANSHSPVGTFIRSNGKIYKCVAINTAQAPTNYYTGTQAPVHDQGVIWDGTGAVVASLGSVGVAWQFVSNGTGSALITSFVSSQHVKATVQNHKGQYSSFPPTVVGGPVSVAGPYNFTGDGTSTTFTGAAGWTSTVADPTQYSVTVGGVFQDPGLYYITLGTPNSITFYIPPANAAAISVNQVNGTLQTIYNLSTGAAVALQGLCLSTYWAFGSFNAIQGYPGDVAYYNDRLMLAATQLQPQTFWGSVVADYLNFGTSDPQVASDSINTTVNARQQNPINNLLPMNNLLLGSASASWRVSDSSGIGSISPEGINVIPQEFYGMQNVPAALTGNTLLYVQWGGRKIRDIAFNFYTDKFQGTELTINARHMVPFGKTFTRGAFAPEPYGLFFGVRSDGTLCVCTYLPEQQVTAWSRWITNGNYEDVCVIPENGAFSVYVIVGRTINGVYQRSIERFAPREYVTLLDANFVDAGVTYDGRNTSATTFTITAAIPGQWGAGAGGIVTSSGGLGAAGVGEHIFFYDSNWNKLASCTITSLSGTIGVTFDTAIPVALQGVATTFYGFTVTTLPAPVQIYASRSDVSGFLDAVPYTGLTTDPAGNVSLPGPTVVAHVGLPFTGKLQSLPFNKQGEDTIRDKRKTIPRGSFIVDQSFDFQAGPDFTHLAPVSIPPTGAAPFTGLMPSALITEPADDAALCVQVTKPVPVRILSWIPNVDIGTAA